MHCNELNLFLVTLPPNSDLSPFRRDDELTSNVFCHSRWFSGRQSFSNRLSLCSSPVMFYSCYQAASPLVCNNPKRGYRKGYITLNKKQTRMTTFISSKAFSSITDGQTDKIFTGKMLIYEGNLHKKKLQRYLN